MGYDREIFILNPKSYECDLETFQINYKKLCEPCFDNLGVYLEKEFNKFLLYFKLEDENIVKTFRKNYKYDSQVKLKKNRIENNIKYPIHNDGHMKK